MDQSYDNLELIVVDDASTDSTERVIGSMPFHINYVRLDKNRGGSYARNKGIEQARGEYLAFLDDDDEWFPEKIQRQVKLLGDLPDEWIGVYCGAEIERTSILKKAFDSLNVTEKGGVQGDLEIQAGLLTMTVFVHGGSTLLVKREAVEEIGGFDEDFPRRQDIEFVLRLTEIGKLAYLEDNLVILHDTPRPGPEKVLEAQNLLMEKFSDKVGYLESNGYDIIDVHNLYVARSLFRKGETLKGLKRLSKSMPKNIRHILGTLVDLTTSFSNIKRTD